MQAKKNNIKTLSFGCRLNALESAKIQAMLAPVIDTAIVVNSCAVTAEAERQSGQAVRRLARENPNAPIFVTGCAATRNPDLFDSIDGVIAIHNRDKMNPDAYISALSQMPCHMQSPRIDHFNHTAPNLSKQFVQIQNGCNHACTYCVTRLLRGRGVSFDYKTILADVIAATENGFNEIVLTGVDIASFAHDGMLISDLCQRLLDDVPGIRRLRLSSMDPASPEIFKIIDMMHRDHRMMPHMHLSMQSGSDPILRAMGRRHTAQMVRDIVAHAPGITFSWDIICGFPGETLALFNDTLALARELGPIHIHAFPFSPRPGTVAADMDGQVAPHVRKSRVKEITAIADTCRDEFMHHHIGDTVQVLAEGNNIGRTPHDIPVKIQGAVIPARTICNITLTDIENDFFSGKSAQNT